MFESNAQNSEAAETWSVVVLYEDKDTRERAMAMCDQLVKKFWSEVEFDFSWWRTDFLRDPAMAHVAANDARTADFIIFCSSPESDLTPAVAKWFATWTGGREGRQGALLDLSYAADGLSPHYERKHADLRDLAHRAGLDYLTRIPQALRGNMPESWEIVQTRATQVTSVLDEILHYPPPSHFGLNE